MEQKEIKSWEIEFDEKFEQEFYDLHYRFCSITDFDKNKTCKTQRDKVVSDIKAFISKVEETARKDERERVIWEARAIVEARIEEITGGDRQYKKYWGINNDICNEISLALKGLDNNK